MTGDTPAASILELCHLKQAFHSAVDREERAEGPHIFKYPVHTFLSIHPRCAHTISVGIWLLRTQSHDTS